MGHLDHHPADVNMDTRQLFGGGEKIHRLMFMFQVFFQCDPILSFGGFRGHATHYTDVTMSPMASQITSLGIVYSTVYSGADQRKHQSSASLTFVRRIHRWPVNSPHKWPVTRKMFPFDDVIMRNPKRKVYIWEEYKPTGMSKQELISSWSKSHRHCHDVLQPQWIWNKIAKDIVVRFIYLLFAKMSSCMSDWLLGIVEAQ